MPNFQSCFLMPAPNPAASLQHSCAETIDFTCTARPGLHPYLLNQRLCLTANSRFKEAGHGPLAYTSVYHTEVIGSGPSLGNSISSPSNRTNCSSWDSTMAAIMRPNIYTDLACVFLVPTLYLEKKRVSLMLTPCQTSLLELDSSRIYLSPNSAICIRIRIL